MKLIAKRIVLISLLLFSISFLSVYAYNHQDQDNYLEYMNIRDQSEDYDALFDNYNLKTFTIVFTQAEFDLMIENMQNHFDDYGDYIDNTMYHVDVIYSDQNDSFTLKEVGFRTKSTTSRNILRTIDWRGREVYHQSTFQLQFNSTFDYESRTNKYEVLKQREAFDLEQLNFEYSQIYESKYDTAMISEGYTHKLYEEAGLIVAKASYTLVYIVVGDEIINYGFYTIIEPIDSEFLKRHFDSNLALEYGDLYKITDVQTEGTLNLDYEDYIGVSDDLVRYTYALRNNTLDGTRVTHSGFDRFVNHINDSEYFLSNYESIIDIDLFVRYLAISFLVGNTDDIRYNYNNYYLYFDVYTNKVTFIPFDLDNALGFGKNYDLSGDYMVDYSVYFNLDNPSPLIENLFEVDSLKTLYINYIQQFCNNFFNYQEFYDEFVIVKDLYESKLVSEWHLGNHIFSLRNVEWYFESKVTNVLNEIS